MKMLAWDHCLGLRPKNKNIWFRSNFKIIWESPTFWKSYTFGSFPVSITTTFSYFKNHHRRPSPGKNIRTFLDSLPFTSLTHFTSLHDQLERGRRALKARVTRLLYSGFLKTTQPRKNWSFAWKKCIFLHKKTTQPLKKLKFGMKKWQKIDKKLTKKMKSHL